MRLTFKSILNILLFSIPLNYIVIEGIGNIYLSTLIIILLFSWLFIVSQGKILIKNNSIFTLLIFLITALTTAINVIFFDSTIFAFQLTNTVIYFQVALAFFIVNYIYDKIGLDYFFKVFVAIAFVAVVRVLIEEPNHFFMLSTRWTERIESYFIGGVNNFALILGVAFIISFFHLKKSKSKIFLSLLFFICIVLTMSRGALLGVILTIFITSFYDTDRRTFKVLIKSIFFLICFVIIFLIFTDKLDLVVEKVNERFFSLFTGEKGADVFFSGRGSLIMNVFDKLSDTSIFQLFFGHGNGGVDFYDPVSGQDYETSHNILIDVLYRNGIFLLLMYMLIFCQLVWMFIKKRSRNKIALFGVFLFFHIELLVNPILFAAQVGWLYAVFYGIFP